MGKVKKKIIVIIAILIFFGIAGVIEEINLIFQGEAQFNDWRVVTGSAITNAFKTVPNAVANFGYYIQNRMVGSLLVSLVEIILCWVLVYCIIAIPFDMFTKGDDIPLNMKLGLIGVSFLITVLLGFLATGEIGTITPMVNQTLNGTGGMLNATA